MTRPGAVRLPGMCLLASVVLAVAGRGALSPPPPSLDGFVEWVDERGAIVAAVALVRVGALAVTSWLAAATAVAVVARAAGAIRLAGIAGRALPAPLRRSLCGIAGTGLASVVALGGPAVAESHGSTEGTATMSVLPDEPAAVPATVPASLFPTAEATRSPVEEWVVAPGDSFWSIAEEVAADALGRAPTDAEIDPYWRRLVDANRDRLVTPYTDLVHPGQAFVLPAFSPGA